MAFPRRLILHCKPSAPVREEGLLGAGKLEEKHLPPPSKHLAFKSDYFAHTGKAGALKPSDEINSR